VKLDHKVAIITGASYGIGISLALLFAKEGDRKAYPFSSPPMLQNFQNFENLISQIIVAFRRQ